MIRFCAKIVGVLAVAIGTGVLIWGASAAALGESMRSPIDVFDIGFMIKYPSEAIGWGAGFLAGGITAILLACSSRR